MTEGQHHLNCLTEAFSALLSSATPESQVDAVRATVNEAKLSFDTLSNFLSKNLLALQEHNSIEFQMYFQQSLSLATLLLQSLMIFN